VQLLHAAARVRRMPTTRVSSRVVYRQLAFDQSAGTPVSLEFKTCHLTSGIQWQQVAFMWQQLAFMWQQVAFMWQQVAFMWQQVAFMWPQVAFMWQQVATGVSWWQCDRISVCA
jgi:hypothetical protein